MDGSALPLFSPCSPHGPTAWTRFLSGIEPKSSNHPRLRCAANAAAGVCVGTKGSRKDARSMHEHLLSRYLQSLTAGRRSECFEIIREAIASGITPETVVTEVIWGAMAHVDKLFKADRINAAIESIACRINRTVADQIQPYLPRKEANGKRIVVCCAESQVEEIGAQMVSDLFQSDGWDVTFVGGEIPDDEMLALISALRPEVLLVFGTQPQGVPRVRQLIDLVREIDACPTMNVVVSGGVFNRADGLWQEVGADIFASSAKNVLKLVNELRPRELNAPRNSVVKKRRRKRKATAA